MKIASLSMLICILLIPISGAYAENSLSVLDAWILEAPPGMKVMAGYMTIRNDTDHAYDLTGVESNHFERVEMHRTIIESEQARMEKQDKMIVKAGDTLRFKPGGSHLMLFNPIKSLKKGDEIDLTLLLRNGNKIKVIAQIRRHSEMMNITHRH